ncbi:MAG: hypothetical protein Q8M76_03165 [Spirochaetaceae bacterium]|nr:hypothetical protein [Spirochaetaceae bacterium]
MRKMVGNAFVLLALVLFTSCASAPPAREPAASTAGPAQQSDGKGRAMALVQGGANAGQPVPAASQPEAAAPSASVAASVDQPPPLPGQLSPEEEAYLQNYLARLNYLVYYNETTSIEPAVAKAAVTQANRYLIEKLGLSVIDYDQIEKNKKDQQAAYKAETGGQIGIIQYLAQKFNAEVYVEIDFTVANETRDGKHYATAQGSMKIFDTSTSGLLGSVALVGKQAFHPSSAALATTNAVAGTVWDAMPKMTEQAKSLLKGSLSRGVRYEVIIQNTPDSKAISQVRRALAKKVREVEQVSYSPEETKLYVYTFQKGDKVEDAMYDAAAAANMNDLYLVYSRGKSYSFNSGM